MTDARVSSTVPLRLIGALLSITALFMLPALLGLLVMGVAGGELPNTLGGWWFFLWTIWAVGLALFNAVFGIVLAHTPRPRWTIGIGVAAVGTILFCPIIWG